MSLFQVKKIVRNLRDHRAKSVQTVQQYVFIHVALLLYCDVSLLPLILIQFSPLNFQAALDHRFEADVQRFYEAFALLPAQ